MWEYNYPDELYHYGVKGMKWGVRKKYYNSDGSLNRRGQARQDYKDAKKDLKTARKQYRKDTRGLNIGIKGIAKSQKAEDRVNKAYMKTIDAKAKYAASKAKNADKAKKAEFKTYTREMSKTGLPGSAADASSRGASTRLYDNIKTQKGKAYADRVQKKVQNQAYATLAASAAVMVGATVASSLLNK